MSDLMKSFTATSILLMAVIGTAAGCNAARNDQGALLTPPEAPAAPPAQNVPLDDQLVADAEKVVRETITAPDPIGRANALEAVEHLPRQSALELLTEGLSDPDARVRFAAAMAAGRLRLQELKPQLEAMAEGSSPNGRVAAVFALHRIGDTSRSQRLAEYALSDDVLVRANTAVALGLLDEPTAVRLLRPMREDPDSNVRLNAAEALWRLRDAEGFEALLAASISGFSDDRVLGTLALAAPADARAQPALEGKLTDDYVEVQLAAARGLGALGSDRGYSVAAARLNDKDARRRAMAALALGEIGRLDAQPRLRPLLADADSYVRLAAATAALKIAETAEARAAGAEVKP